MKIDDDALGLCLQLVIIFLIGGLLIWFVLGFSYFSSTHPEYVTAVITSENNSWTSGFYTYRNFTLSYANYSIAFIVVCDYYHLGSPVNVTPDGWWSGMSGISSPQVPVGCAPPSPSAPPPPVFKPPAPAAHPIT